MSEKVFLRRIQPSNVEEGKWELDNQDLHRYEYSIDKELGIGTNCQAFIGVVVDWNNIKYNQRVTLKKVLGNNKGEELYQKEAFKYLNSIYVYNEAVIAAGRHTSEVEGVYQEENSKDYYVIQPYYEGHTYAEHRTGQIGPNGKIVPDVESELRLIDKILMIVERYHNHVKEGIPTPLYIGDIKQENFYVPQYSEKEHTCDDVLYYDFDIYSERTKTGKETYASNYEEFLSFGRTEKDRQQNDIKSVLLMLYQRLFDGELPRKKTIMGQAVLEYDIREVESVSKGISVPLKQMFEKGFSKAPFQTCEELRDALHEILTCLHPKKEKTYTNKNEHLPITKFREPLGETYVERSELLGLLYGKLHQPDEEGRHYCYVTGMGGAGKSELIRAYIYEKRREYAEIFWFTCRDGEKPCLTDLMKKSSYEIPEEKLDTFFDYFGDETLVVIDNCNEESKAFREELFAKLRKVHVIVSTRLSMVKQINKAHRVRINSYEHSSFAYDVFEKNYTKEIDDDDEDEISRFIRENERVYVGNICQSLGYSPLLISLVAIELRERRNGNIKMFSEQLGQGLKAVIPVASDIAYDIDMGVYGDNVPETAEVFEILKILFRDFLSHDFSTYERQLLNLLSLCPAEYQDKEFVFEILGDNAKESQIKKACNKLTRYNWLQNAGENVYIHPLIAEVLQLNDEIKFTEEEWASFGEHVLKNWLVMGEDREINISRGLNINFTNNNELQMETSRKNDYIVNKLYHKVQAWITDANFETIIMYYLNMSAVYFMLRKRVEETNGHTILLSFVEYTYGKCLYWYDCDTQIQTELLNLSNRKIEERYWDIQGEEIINQQNSAICAGVLLIDCYGGKELVKLPDKINGADVKYIGSHFWRYNPSIYKLVLPINVENVGARAFYKCQSIMEMPKQLEHIGSYAFAECENLRGDLQLERVKMIPEGAFSLCDSVKSIKLSKDLVEIGAWAFEGCDNITGDLNFYSELKTIGFAAFKGCSGFTGDLIIPEKVESIGGHAFENCYGFSGELKLESQLEKIGDYVFAGCRGFVGDLIIPEKVKSIGESAFEDCSRFNGKLFLHNNLEEIGRRAFYQSGGFLRSFFKKTMEGQGFVGDLTIPESVESIGESAFAGCSGFSGKLTLSPKLKKISDYAFQGCSGFIGDLNIPEKVESIGEYAFAWCSGFSGKLTLPKKLEKISDYAFLGCSGFIGDLAIPESVESIGVNAFYGCVGFLEKPTYIRKSKVNEYKQSLVEDQRVKKMSFAFEAISKHADDIIKEFQKSKDYEKRSEKRRERNRKLSSISEKIRTYYYEKKGIFKRKVGWIYFSKRKVIIEEYSFYKSQIYGVLKLHSGIKHIGTSAFERCENLWGDLELPENVTVVDDSAFANCKGLDGKLILPKHAKVIGDNTFEKCEFHGELKLPNDIVYVGRRAFVECKGFKKLTLSAQLEVIMDEAFFRCGDFSSGLVVPNHVKYIGAYAFFGCKFSGELKFSNDVRMIGENAFHMCGFTGALHLPKKLRYLEKNAFSYCAFEGDLEIPPEIAEISDSAFRCCGFSGKLTLPIQLEHIGNSAFEMCEFTGDLNLFHLLGLKYIGNSAFEECSGFAGKLTLPSNLEFIGKRAFKGCSGLNGVLEVPESVTIIGDEAFEGCSFEKIILKNNTVSLGRNFADCVICAEPGSLTELEACIRGYLFEAL